jgi:Mn2+/Fe2+ NRAMP family transporter
VWVVPIAVGLGALLSFGSFDRVRDVFAILPLAFLAYVAGAFVAHPNWHAVLSGFVPQMPGGRRTAVTMLAMFGTLLTSYAYLWQTVEVATDRPPRRALRAIELSTLPGLLLTFAVLWFILITTAATLGVHHHAVQSAQDAAGALAPFAGRWAPIIFALGLLGSSVLAVPVIVATTANAVAVTFCWGGSLDDAPRNAKPHYAVVYGALAIAAALCFTGVPVITLLFVASIAGGIATPLTLAPLMLLVRDRSVMRDRRAPRWLAAAGWSAAAIVSFAAAASIAQT